MRSNATGNSCLVKIADGVYGELPRRHRDVDIVNMNRVQGWVPEGDVRDCRQHFRYWLSACFQTRKGGWNEVIKGE